MDKFFKKKAKHQVSIKLVAIILNKIVQSKRLSRLWKIFPWILDLGFRFEIIFQMIKMKLEERIYRRLLVNLITIAVHKEKVRKKINQSWLHHRLFLYATFCLLSLSVFDRQRHYYGLWQENQKSMN
jgi:hypothetical protein